VLNPVSNLPQMADLNNYLVDRLQNQAANPQASTPGTQSVTAATMFTQALSTAVGSLSGLQANADQAVSGLALNGGVEIHQVRIAVEQASLGMQLSVQVRDKAVEAYQSLMNMQL
jgi:flagellar hook-basal body complex protein FliE